MSMSSVLNYSDRGPYGDARYRGNCSGRLVRDLLLHYRPELFCDVTLGGGTSADVVRELAPTGLPRLFVGLDLRLGFNLLRDRLADRLPGGADLIFFHPPYHTMIPYSGPGGVWGQGRAHHPDDLSRCADYEEFLYKLRLACLNIHEALGRGGRYAVLVGDLRRGGCFYHLAADLRQVAPGLLEAVQVKLQHNCHSRARRYPNEADLIRIDHEYLLHFRRDGLVVGLLGPTLETSCHLERLSKATWKALITSALGRLGGKAPLGEIYREIEREAENKTRSRKRVNWQAKVRQLLQLEPEYHSPTRGVWGLLGPSAEAAASGS